MKKKMVLYMTGVAVCMLAVVGLYRVTGSSSAYETVEEKKLPVRNAAIEKEAEALSGEESLTETIDDMEGAEKTEEYLSYYFGISLKEDGFSASLQKICLSDEKAESEREEKSETEKWPALSMIEETIKAVGKEQLAYTYSEEKVKKRMEFYGISDNQKKEKKREEKKAFLICALDLNLINQETAQHALDGELSDEEQNSLLMAAAGICGKGRNCLGYSNEADIFAKLRFVQGLYEPFSDETLYEAVHLLLEEELTEECVLKSTSYEARFLPSLTVVYRHESLEHMEELLGLLNSENLVAKVQLEPKCQFDKSDAEQLKGWAEEKEAEEKEKEGKDKEAETEEAKEEAQTDVVPCFGSFSYDLVLEFETKEDMARFEELVNEYSVFVEEAEYTYVAAGSTEASEENSDDSSSEESQNVNNREIEKVTILSDRTKMELYCLSEEVEELMDKLADWKPSHQKYMCNKQFFYALGGKDEVPEDTDEEKETEEEQTEEQTKEEQTKEE